jgi:hypothetical protein
MPRRPDKQPYWNRRVREERRVESLSHTTLVNQRGFKGTTLGPANEGRSLSTSERAEIERKMREDGKL